MDIRVIQEEAIERQTPLLVLPVVEGGTSTSKGFEAVDALFQGLLRRLIARGDFKGKECEAQLVFPGEGQLGGERVLLLGLGKAAKLDAERYRRAAATAVKQAARLRLDRVSIVMPANDAAASIGRAIAEGAHLGGYRFDELKTPEPDEPPPVAPEVVEILVGGDSGLDDWQNAVRIGSVLGRAENLARTLGNLPGNVATPSYLVEKAREVGQRRGLAVSIMGPEELRREGMNALLAVSQGSEEPPALIVMEHRRGGDSKPLVLVGKGLTFDSGGISIKPSLGMEEMKFDMCGGAAVIAAMDAIGELGVPLNVIGVVPSSENLLSGRSMKPGDIVRSHAGKTIEIINTDAEGRLILADALSYVQRFEPAAIVDAATLTGACVIALGSFASGAMTNDESLLEEVRAAGERVSQPVWPLPMFDEYREQIKSDYADIKNSGGRAAGTITAGWFLREFVGDTPWVHLDIAGTANGEGKLSYHSKGSTGVPTRLFVEWVLNRAG